MYEIKSSSGKKKLTNLKDTFSHFQEHCIKIQFGGLSFKILTSMYFLASYFAFMFNKFP